MSMVVRNNGSAALLRRALHKSSGAATSHLNNLATEMKINGAGDSAADYTISERMRCKLHGLDQALSNAQTSSNVLKRASGALNDQIDLMKRVHTLAIQAADDTRTDEDRAILQKDVGQMLTQIDNIARETTYNTHQLLDQKTNLTDPADTCRPEFMLHLQTANTASQGTSIFLANTTLDMLFPASSEHWYLEPKESDYPSELAVPLQPVSSGGQSQGLDGHDHDHDHDSDHGHDSSASSVNTEISESLQEKRAEWRKTEWPYPARIVDLDKDNCLRDSDTSKVFLEDAGQALKYLLHVSSTFGAQSMRLEQTGNNLTSQLEMLQNSESKIRDADVAKEAVGLAKSNVLVSSSKALLAQANQNAGGIVSLLES